MKYININLECTKGKKHHFQKKKKKKKKKKKPFK